MIEERQKHAETIRSEMKRIKENIDNLSLHLTEWEINERYIPACVIEDLSSYVTVLIYNLGRANGKSVN